MNRLYVYSHNPYSKGAIELAHALDARRIKHKNSKFKGSRYKTVINWGASKVPQEVMKCNIINGPSAIALSSNKLFFFRRAHDKARLPEFAENLEEAKKLLTNGPICARIYLSSSSGKGIRYIDKEEDIVEARLYTKYIPKMSEFRLHIFRGEIIDIQRKARRLSIPDEEVNWKIRNLDNGFVYTRQKIVCPKDCKEQALAAFSCFNLDFGAVDVVWNQKQKKAYVLEVNTAPGLEGSTVDSYAEAFSGNPKEDM